MWLGNTMTGLTNAAADGELAPQPQFAELGGIETPSEVASLPSDGSEGWRDEVTARLARYRARRKPRAPHYPSLLLPFDSAEREPWSRPASPYEVAAPTGREAAFEETEFTNVQAPPREAIENQVFDSVRQEPTPYVPVEPSAKIIEFPRSAAIPVFESSLADPIFDRPRIIEAPEILPPPPALGGILIEPPPAPKAENRRVESEIQPASIARRLLATAVDGLILLASLSGFAEIFVRFNPVRGPLVLLAGAVAAFAVALWFVYQYWFIVYTASTPGLRAACLKLASFDGSTVPRRLRRWRVLASMLSGFSAALGYIWCFLDADSLCWHDRITRTYLRVSTRPSSDRSARAQQ